MRIVALLCLAVVTACQTLLPPAAGGGAVIDTTIAAVVANPDAFHGKVIRVRGTVSSCWGEMCRICDPAPQAEHDPQAKCIELDFAPGDFGASELLEQLYRFSNLTAVGAYGSYCYNDKPGVFDNTFEDSARSRRR